MNVAAFVAVGGLSAVPVVFTTMMASLVLLGVRAWCGITEVALTRSVSILLNSSCVVMVALFLVLVFVRFRTLA